MTIKIEAEIYKVKPCSKGGEDMYVTYRGDNLEKGVEPRVRVNVYTLVDDIITEDLRIKLGILRDKLVEKFYHSFAIEKDMWVDFINRSFAYTNPFENKRLKTCCVIYRDFLEDKTVEEVDEKLEQSFNEAFNHLYIQAASIQDLLNNKGTGYSVTIEKWASKNEWEVSHCCGGVREIKESEEQNQIKDKWVKIIKERVEAVKDKIVDRSEDLRLYGNTGWCFGASTGWSDKEMNSTITDWIENYLCKEKM